MQIEVVENRFLHGVPSVSFATYTPRYTAYCKARGYATPEAQQQADGNMSEFMAWIAAAWTAFGIPPGQRHAHQTAFDAWLPSFIQNGA